ncbi:hypothetical protein ACFQDE_20610 [Deinococcus caeni]|uniref:hypothetical protein n=1 Tax=Deinococcus caeni TaxID=569127 RepID=UPI00361C0AA3
MVLAERSAGVLRGNQISANALYGLIVTGNATPEISENTLTENGSGGSSTSRTQEGAATVTPAMATGGRTSAQIWLLTVQALTSCRGTVPSTEERTRMVCTDPSPVMQSLIPTPIEWAAKPIQCERIDS